jgi:1-acyl-sn-glycerol-3-phosphate acyltransferase
MRRLAEALSYLRTFLVTLPLVYLSTVVFGSVSLVVSLFDATGRGQHACARVWARSLLLFAGVRVVVRGLENIAPGRTYIFAANHQSYMDIPVAFARLPVNFRIMAKASLFHIPFLGWHLRRSGHLLVERDNPLRAARSLLAAASHIRSGTPVFVFPEGGRSPDGHFQEFKAGMFLLAIKAGVPVIPVTLNGTRAVLKMRSWNIRPGRVEMILHAPIPTEGLHFRAAQELSARVRDTIAAAFDEVSATSAD